MKMLLITITVIAACSFIFSVIQSLMQRREFRDYLISINDLDTAKKLGWINSEGKNTLRSVLVLQVREIIWRKYEETENEEYCNFYEDYMRNYKQGIGSILILFLIYVIVSIN
jgi:basic membrane lipoprotein Med (substrate-binding protein (PBP1-ABC) superfamily)